MVLPCAFDGKSLIFLLIYVTIKKTLKEFI